jgi:predicted dehydrogenase
MALEQGCAVLCDKPFGLDEADARLMRDRAHALGLPNFVNFELRWRPTRLKVGRLLDQGAIGALSHVNWTLFGSDLRQQRHGWLHDAGRGGGWVGAYGAHCIDALSVWTGSKVARCGGIARRDMSARPDADGVLRPCSAEDAFSAWIEFDSGVTVTLDTAFSTAANVPERILLFGSDGAIEVQDDAAVILHRPDGHQERFDFPASAGDAYAPALDGWLGAVRRAVATKQPLIPDFDAGLDNARALATLRAGLVQGSMSLGSEQRT